jgi:hypothetical protein
VKYHIFSFAYKLLFTLTKLQHCVDKQQLIRGIQAHSFWFHKFSDLKDNFYGTVLQKVN